MYEVTVDIGKNIGNTAKESGAPRYGVENHWGLHIYELVNIKPDVVVKFRRPGFEITATPLFALTMYADSENNNDLAVEKIELQYSYHAKNHQDAKKFINSIVKQFQLGKWKRFIGETCPAVMGRSTYLDINNKVSNSCPLDPAFQPPMEDWLLLLRLTTCYEWIGDGVLATLSVGFDEDSRGLTYNIDIELQDFAINERRNAAAQALKLAEGDKKGWRSTESYKKGMADNKAAIKILEANAVRRGDRIVSRE